MQSDLDSPAARQGTLGSNRLAIQDRGGREPQEQFANFAEIPRLTSKNSSRKAIFDSPGRHSFDFRQQ
jgi:hypothetical protein